MTFFRRAGAEILRILSRLADPAPESDRLLVYSKLVSGVSQLFAMSSDGAVHQITPPPGSCTVDVDFGAALSTDARVTVTGQAWVTATSRILVAPAGVATADHGAEDAVIEEIQAVAYNLIPGVGFDVVAHSPYGSTGIYRLSAIGA